jgi:heparanase 1
MSKRDVGFFLAVIMAMLANSGCSKVPVGPPAVSITPVSMQRIASVDERYQSFNIEMIEVTGGRFWKPYKDIEGLLKKQAAPKADGSVPAGMDPGLYQQRPPINLGNARLRALAAGLAPAYMRVSGTWANTTYFHDSDSVAPAAPPKGFSGVLTRPQWKGVVDFSKAADAKLVTSFATSPGTRDALGLWAPKEARKLLAYTKAVGGSIAAAEYMNEPTYAEMGGAPKGYDAAAYGRDIAVFRPFMKQSVPEMILLGPGGVGEGVELAPIGLAGNELKSEDLLKATGPAFDAFSYHSYGATSKRCASMGPASQRPPFRRTFCHAPTRLRSFTPLSATNLSRASRSGLQKRLMPPAAAIRGHRRFWTAFGISTNSGVWRNVASGSRCTTRWHPVIMAFWMKIPSPHAPTTGRLFFGGN